MGYVAYKGGKPRKVADYIRETMEEATRFVCEAMGYTPSEVWHMDTYEFFRDLRRSKKKQAAQIKQLEKQLEKWRKK